MQSFHVRFSQVTKQRSVTYLYGCLDIFELEVRQAVKPRLTGYGCYLKQIEEEQEEENQDEENQNAELKKIISETQSTPLKEKFLQYSERKQFTPQTITKLLINHIQLQRIQLKQKKKVLQCACCIM